MGANENLAGLMYLEKIREYRNKKVKKENMKKTPHTPEPWHRHLTQDKLSVFADNWMICSLSHSFSEKETHANASRIVSCVNAMAGIEDPKKLRETWDSIQHLELDAYQKLKEKVGLMRNMQRKLDKTGGTITELQELSALEKEVDVLLNNDEE